MYAYLSDQPFLSEPLAEFGRAVRKSVILRKKSITSRSIREFQCRRAASIGPRDRLSRSTKKPRISSRFSIADNPMAGALAAFGTFTRPIDVLDERMQEYEDDEGRVSVQQTFCSPVSAVSLRMPYVSEHY